MQSYFHKKTDCDRQANLNSVRGDVIKRAEHLKRSLEGVGDLISKPEAMKLVKLIIVAILNFEMDDLEEAVDACYADPQLLHEPGMRKFVDDTVQIVEELSRTTTAPHATLKSDNDDDNDDDDDDDDDDSTDEEIGNLPDDAEQTRKKIKELTTTK